MARYTIRVELHQATREDYATLAANLAKYGITDILTDDSGTKYKMPPAEYNYDGPALRAKALEMAEAAAATTRRKYAVLVTESSGRTWTGLDVVK